MSQQAVDAFRSEREVLLGTLRSLDEDQWAAPSGCEGWSVQDIVIHMYSTLQLVADPEHALFPDPALPAEAGIDAVVAARRGESAADTLAAYEAVSAKAVDAFAGLQAPGLAEAPLDMGDLGTHPMHMIPGAFAFDVYTHLRHDLVPPRGTLTDDLAPVDPVVLDATIEWLLAGLEQMCTAALKPLTTKPWVLRLTGPGGGEWTCSPTDDPNRACAVSEGAAVDAAATIECSAVDFVSFSTHREPWHDLVKIEGDEGYATDVLDAIHLF